MNRLTTLALASCYVYVVATSGPPNEAVKTKPQKKYTSLSNSKLSIHSGGGDSSFNLIGNAHPRVVKLLDNFGDTATKIKQINPRIVVVGRIYLPNQPQTGDPVAAAQTWLQQNNDTIMSSPDVDFWEGYNEPDCSSVDAVTWLGKFDAERVQLLAAQGRRASVGNFGVGNPGACIPPHMNRNCSTQLATQITQRLECMCMIAC